MDKLCALDKNATTFKYSPNKKQKYDLLLTGQGKKKTVLKQLKNQLQKHRGVKWFICSKVKMVKSSPEGEDQVSTPHLEFQREGSGWQLSQVIIIIIIINFDTKLIVNDFFFTGPSSRIRSCCVHTPGTLITFSNTLQAFFPKFRKPIQAPSDCHLRHLNWQRIKN